MITAKKIKNLTAFGLLNISSSVFAGSMGPAVTAPETGLFVGLGGSYNSVKLDQSLNPLNFATD